MYVFSILNILPNVIHLYCIPPIIHQSTVCIDVKYCNIYAEENAVTLKKNLLAHDWLLQILVSSDRPEHCLPPFSASLRTERDLDCTPPPQEALQADQSLYRDHSQSTAKRKEKKGFKRYYNACKLNLEGGKGT